MLQPNWPLETSTMMRNSGSWLVMVIMKKRISARRFPYLETYVNSSKTVSRQDLFELSYCYYQTKNYNKAIEGFKQLGGKDDSLAQNAMYLLGDAYLKTGQKANARNAFLFCASNSSYPAQKEISQFHYAKLSYELGYPDVALDRIPKFFAAISEFNLCARSPRIIIKCTGQYQ